MLQFSNCPIFAVLDGGAARKTPRNNPLPHLQQREFPMAGGSLSSLCDETFPRRAPGEVEAGGGPTLQVQDVWDPSSK